MDAEYTHTTIEYAEPDFPSVEVFGLSIVTNIRAVPEVREVSVTVTVGADA
jgi:hypothetical protein